MPDNDRWRNDGDRYREDPWADAGGREDFGGGTGYRSPPRRGGAESYGQGGGYDGRRSEREPSRGGSERSGPEGYRRDQRRDRDEGYPGGRRDQGGEGSGGNDYLGGFYGADQGYGRGRQGWDRGESDRGFGNREREDWRERDQGRSRGDWGSQAFGRDDSARNRSGRDDRLGEDRGFMDRAGDEVASWFGDEDAARRRQRDAREGDEGAQHHRGRGPKNYQRSDDRIRDDINDRLTEDSQVDASDIEVSVSGREVTLSGTVDSRYAKRRAEDVAESVSGVQHVQNNLRVGAASRTGSSSGPGSERSSNAGLGPSEGGKTSAKGAVTRRSGAGGRRGRPVTGAAAPLGGNPEVAKTRSAPGARTRAKPDAGATSGTRVAGGFTETSGSEDGTGMTAETGAGSFGTASVETGAGTGRRGRRRKV